MTRISALCRLSGRLLLVAWLLSSLIVSSSFAQDPTKANGQPSVVVDEAPTLEQRRVVVEQELAEVLSRIENLSEDAPPERRNGLQKELELLRRVELLMNQQKSASERVSELNETVSQLTIERDDLLTRGPDESPPYSLLLVDSIRDELETQEARDLAIQAAVEATSGAVVDARRVLDDRELSRRRASDAVDSNSDDTRRSELASALRIAQLESQVASEMVALRQIELERESRGKDIHTLRLEILRNRLQWVSTRSGFTKSDLDAKLVEIETMRAQIRRRLEELERNALDLERWSDAAKSRRNQSITPDAALIEEVTARQLALQAVRETIDAMNKRLDYADGAEVVWGRRYELLRGNVENETLKTWEEESRERINALSIEQSLITSRAEEKRGTLSSVTARLESADTSAPERPWLRDQQSHLRGMSETFDERRRSIEAAHRLHTRLLNEIGVEAAKVTLAERLSGLWSSVTDIWKFPVGTVDTKEITIGKIVIGTIILLFGLFASKSLSRLLGRRILPRFRLDEGGSAAVQSILFYILVVTFTLFALRAVNIPLTAFTVLGGALAIGVGFGSQNIIANFISGLILLAERPIRVGDLIQIEDLFGTVEQIGARSARIRTGNNIDIVVPNSKFLEQNVINWTLSEDRIRTHVCVGVMYGSSTRDVSKLLMRAVEEHGRVHKKPSPVVLFTEFGDNSLNFEVHFWLTMKRTMDRRIIESDVRYRIDSLFHDAGLVIAFPQRDVHLDTVTPLEVRMVSDPRDAVATDAGAAMS